MTSLRAYPDSVDQAYELFTDPFSIAISIRFIMRTPTQEPTLQCISGDKSWCIARQICCNAGCGACHISMAAAGAACRRAALPCVQATHGYSLVTRPLLSTIDIGTFRVFAVMSKWNTGTGMSPKLIHITRNTDGYFCSGLKDPPGEKVSDSDLHSTVLCRSNGPDRVATTLGLKGT